MTRIRLVLASVVSLSLLSAGALPADATICRVEPRQAIGPSASPSDIEAYDTDLAAGWQVSFESLVAEIAQKYPEQYSSQVFGEDHLSGVILFIDSVPAGVEELVKRVPEVTAQVGGKFSTDERARVEEALRGAADKIFVDTSLFIGFDYGRDLFVVRYDQKASGLSVEEVTASLKSFAALPEGIPLTVEAADGPPVSLQAIQGGRSISQNRTSPAVLLSRSKRTTDRN